MARSHFVLLSCHDMVTLHSWGLKILGNKRKNVLNLAHQKESAGSYLVWSWEIAPKRFDFQQTTCPLSNAG